MFDKLHPADIAEIIKRLHPEKRKTFFRSLDPDMEAKVLKELDVIDEGELIKELDKFTVSDLLSALPADDATDIIAGFSDEEREGILRLMKEPAAREVRKLLVYGKETAGGKMTPRFVAVPAEATASDALKLIRGTAEDVPIQYVYVIKNSGRLVGVISIEKLIKAQADTKVDEIMNHDVISVPATMDQEEVAAIVSKYDLLAVPVVDDDGDILGIVTVDDIIDVIKEENTEDIYRMAGTDDEELLNRSIFSVARIRLPWLLATLFGGIIASLLMKHHTKLATFVPLTFFVPVIMGMGGNIGIQSSTIVIRGLATGRIELGLLGKSLFRELGVGVVMGTVCGLVVSGIALALGLGPQIGLVVGVSMLTAITVAATMGCLIPMIFKRLKIDPAIASGPFVTTCNDITGLLIYFTLATVLFRMFGNV